MPVLTEQDYERLHGDAQVRKYLRLITPDHSKALGCYLLMLPVWLLAAVYGGYALDRAGLYPGNWLFFLLLFLAIVAPFCPGRAGAARLLYGGATDDGQPYIAMEYVRGESITHYSDAHRLTVGQRLALFRQVCQAVAFAHSYSVIHRDIKPGNIFVTRDGEVKLLDFGIAKLLDPAAADSAAGHGRPRA